MGLESFKSLNYNFHVVHTWQKPQRTTNQNLILNLIAGIASGFCYEQ